MSNRHGRGGNPPGNRDDRGDVRQGVGENPPSQTGGMSRGAGGFQAQGRPQQSRGGRGRGRGVGIPESGQGDISRGTLHQGRGGRGREDSEFRGSFQGQTRVSQDRGRGGGIQESRGSRPWGPRSRGGGQRGRGSHAGGDEMSRDQERSQESDFPSLSPASSVDVPDVDVSSASSKPSSSTSKSKHRGSEKSFPSRPGLGTLGTPIELEVNCWDFDVTDINVYMHDIMPISLEVSGGRMKTTNEKAVRKYIKYAIEDIGKDYFYDNGRYLYCLRPLIKAGKTEDIEKTIKDPLGQDELKIKYRLKLVNTVSAESIKSYISNPKASTKDFPQEGINMLDTLLKWINGAVFATFTKNGGFFEEPLKTNTKGLFWVYYGFSLSVRPQWKMRLNIDKIHRAFFPSGNLADILYGKFGDRMYQPQCWRQMANAILTLRVEAGHYKNNGVAYKRHFTVHGLSPARADQELIVDLQKTVAEYYLDKYGLELRYPELPCVKVKKDKNEYIPMELLTVLPFQNSREEAGIVASEIVRCAAVPPPERFNDLRVYVNKFKTIESVLKAKFGMQVGSQVKLKGRVLPQPHAQFGDGRRLLDLGKWNPSKFVNVPGDLMWALTRNSDSFVAELHQTGRRFGIQLAAKPFFYRKTVAELRNLFDEFRNKNIKLGVFVLNGTNEYSYIKREGDLNSFMVTQCVKDITLSKRNVCGNILLKINAKLGGLNWIVMDFPVKRNNDLIMVMGADVTHPSPTGGNRDFQKSVAAVIASMSRDLMRYVAIVRQQERNKTEEYIADMEGIFYDLLKRFGETNGDLPSKVIFYRDGVSEGQFAPVLVKELAGMQTACSRIRNGYQPGFTFIVVQKRHHIRRKNVPPGTVVDHDITHKREFDFYLCSQEGIQGTSKPAHYHVLYDDNDIGADDLQSFTYYLCHAYMRCTRTVSYPAPTYYSHLAAFRARDWLKNAGRDLSFIRNNRFLINEDQQNLMFFL